MSRLSSSSRPHLSRRECRCEQRVCAKEEWKTKSTGRAGPIQSIALWAESLSLRTTGMLGGIILRCPVHYRPLSNLPGLYPLRISSNLLPCGSNNKKPKSLPLDIAECPLGNHPQWRATAPRRLNFNLLAKGSCLMILSIGSNMIRYTSAFQKGAAMYRLTVEGQTGRHNDQADQ